MSAFRRGEESCIVKRADSLLKPLVRDLGIGDGVRLAQIKSQWHALFQKPLSHHMAPSVLSGDELLLSVDSPVWLQELKFYQAEIIKKLVPYQVKSVRFRLGRVPAAANQEDEREVRKCKALTACDRSFIEDSVSEIHDKELKETLQKTIAKAMTAGKVT
jgi:hypothetical protein